MSGTVPAPTFTLQRPLTPDVLRTLRSDAARAVEGGASHLAIDVNEVGILDSAVISTLIAVLRDARARGASVELRAERQSILDTLRITALDKIFTICAPVASAVLAAPPPAKRPRRSRLLASIGARP